MTRRLPSPRSLLRGLVALLAVCAVAVGVSACRVQPGAAAFVGDQKISESDVAALLVPGTTVAATAGQPSARQTAVSFLVIRDLARDYTDSKGIGRGSVAIASVRSTVLGTDEASVLAQARTEAEQGGLTSSFVDLRVEVVSLLALMQKAGVQEADLPTALGKGPKVTLSPRYGTWDAASLSITSKTPDYLTLTGTTAPAPA